MLGNKNFALDTSIYFGSPLLDQDVIYNVQNVTLPGLTFNHQQIGTKFGTFLNSTADSVEFNDLQISILLDDNFISWTKLINIALNMVSVDKGFAAKEEDSYIMITNAMGNEVTRINFYNSKIMSIGDLNYSSANENEILSLDITIKYDYFKIEKLSETEDDSLINFNKKLATIKNDAKEPINFIDTTTTIEE